MPNTVRRPDDDRRRWEAQRRRQRTTQLERQSLMGPMDLPFLLLTLLLTGVGLVMVFSASFPSAYYETGDGTYYFKRQLIFAVLGLFAMVVMSRIAEAGSAEAVTPAEVSATAAVQKTAMI